MHFRPEIEIRDSKSTDLKREKRKKKEREKEGGEEFKRPLINVRLRGTSSLFINALCICHFETLISLQSFYLFAIEWSIKGITSRDATTQDRKEGLILQILLSSFISSELITPRERSFIFPVSRTGD